MHGPAGETPKTKSSKSDLKSHGLDNRTCEKEVSPVSSTRQNYVTYLGENLKLQKNSTLNSVEPKGRAHLFIQSLLKL